MANIETRYDQIEYNAEDEITLQHTFTPAKLSGTVEGIIKALGYNTSSNVTTSIHAILWSGVWKVVQYKPVLKMPNKAGVYMDNGGTVWHAMDGEYGLLWVSTEGNSYSTEDMLHEYGFDKSDFTRLYSPIELLLLVDSVAPDLARELEEILKDEEN